MTPRTRLVEALADIPAELLDEETRGLVGEAMTSLEAADSIDDEPLAVVVVGRSGSGKSTLVNALIKADVSAVGPLRPTTKVTVMAGSSGPASLPSESEYVHVSDAPSGIVLVDTPSWDHDRDAAATAMDLATVIVLVVTPARYADRAVAEIRSRIPKDATTFVVLNRAMRDADDWSELIASVEAIHGRVVVVEEGGGFEAVEQAIGSAATPDRSVASRRAVLDRSAAATAKVVAERLTRQATDVGRVEAAIAGYGRAVMPRVAVLEDWDETRSNVVAALRGVVAAVDGALVDAGGDLGRRIFEGLSPVTTAEVGASVDAWREEVEEILVSRVRTWWRPKAARELASRYAPRMGIDPEVALPARLVRTLGSRLHAVVDEAHASFETLVASTADNRVDAWTQSASRLGRYTPGNLLTAADAFDR